MKASSVGVWVCAALTACAAGPDFKPPKRPDSVEGAFQSGSTAIDQQAAPPDDWWQLYDDPRLSAFVAEALRANTDLRVAAANLAQVRAVLREADSGRYPSTQIGAGKQYGRNLIADSVAGASHHEAENQVTDLASLDVSYEADLFGRVSRAIEAAQADSEAVRAARDMVIVVVVAETSRAYMGVRNAGRELAVAQRSVELADESVAIVERQAAAGAASSFDVARVRAVAHQARAQLPALSGRQRAALLELTALMGRTPAQSPVLAKDIDADADGPAKRPPALPVGDGAGLLARRPDVRQAERRLAAATARIGVATSALYPRISFGANVGYASNSILQGSNSFTLAVGPLVSWTFPNQAVARARIEQANAGASAALASFDGTVLRALKETEQAIVALDTERARGVELAATEIEAEEAYRLASIRRREGTLSQLDLLVAEQSLISARGATASADTRISDAQIALFRALGGGWRTTTE